MRTPTPKQAEFLRVLGNGCAALAITKGKFKPLENHGWVTGDPSKDGRFYSWVRITPDGLRALALAQERDGLPDIGPKEKAPDKMPDPPRVRDLRQARDEARAEADEERRRRLRAEGFVRRVAYALEGWEDE